MVLKWIEACGYTNLVTHYNHGDISVLVELI